MKLAKTSAEWWMKVSVRNIGHMHICTLLLPNIRQHSAPLHLKVAIHFFREFNLLNTLFW